MAMEILSNFSSIYCFIAFVIGAVFMLIAVCVVAMGKTKEPKVRFYVKRDMWGFELWMEDPRGLWHFILYITSGDDYFIDTKSFEDMDYDEIRKVNLMED